MTATEVTEPLDNHPPIHQSINPSDVSPDNILDIHKSGHPRNGKIAKMTKEQRDQLNQMLAEGATGAVIIDAFARHGIFLNHENVSNWRQGGHQDWLQLQVWRAEMIAEAESVSDLFTNNDESTFHQVVIRVAITQIFQSLKKGKLNDDPANYTRLLNSLARLTREALCLRKYGDARADARAPLQPRPDYERKLTDKERQAIVRKVDEVLGLASPGPDTETSSEGGPEAPEPTRDSESGARRPPAPISTVASFNGDRTDVPRHPVPPKSDEGGSQANAPTRSHKPRRLLVHPHAPNRGPRARPCTRSASIQTTPQIPKRSSSLGPLYRGGLGKPIQYPAQPSPCMPVNPGKPQVNPTIVFPIHTRSFNSSFPSIDVLTITH